MNVEPPFQLKQTNVSRPQLVHSGSQQSIAASEDFYSLSERPSSASDDRTRAAPLRYHTPPSRLPTPVESHEHLEEPESSVNALKGVGRARQQPQPTQPTQPTTDAHAAHSNYNAQSAPTETTAAQGSINTEPEEMGSQPPQSGVESPSTTPGIDTTPYIRFAIDQLTRDEEVRGSRQYPLPEPAEAVEKEYPTERVVSDEGLGYMAQEEEKNRRLSRPPQPSHEARQVRIAASTLAPTRSIGPKEPATGVRRSPERSVQPDIFVPFRATPDSYQHAPLKFRPGILRPLWMGIFIVLCLAMLVALIFSAVYSNRNSGTGLWSYTAFGDIRYFIFEYLPALLGMIILMWLYQIQIALQRTIPFISMASVSTKQRSDAVFLELYPMQFLLPKLEYFRAGQPLIGTCYIIFWLFTWTVPLLSATYNVRYVITSSEWRWVATQGVIWTVIVLYVLLVSALMFLMIFLIRKETGLKWDPRSLADIIALLERSNIMNDYDGSETFSKNEFRQQLANRTDRIGYWHTSKRPNDIFYGIGEEGGATRRYSIEEGRIREKGPEKASRDPSVQRPGDFSIRMDIRSSRVRLRYLPWYLKDTSVVAWIVAAVVLCIAFLVISFVNSAVRDGFLPQLSARTNSAGFSASNFLYSFVPALIGHILFLIILSFDYSIRTLQPYMSLSRKGGSTAESSILLDYAARFPISVTLAALANKHYQPAFLSLTSFLSATLPILAGGCFWTQYYPNSSRVRVSADLNGYYALCFFLALYTLGLFALLPGRRRAALPHRSTSLAEIISWLYQSQILTDRAFNRPQTKPELVARLMGNAYAERSWMASVTALVRPSRDNLRDGNGNGNGATEENGGTSRKARATTDVDPEKRNTMLDPAAIKYGFGIHVGRDGLEHLGIDRVRRGGERSGRELVIWEEQERRKRRSWVGSAA